MKSLTQFLYESINPASLEEKQKTSVKQVHGIMQK